jgi:hypothetical protein
MVTLLCSALEDNSCLADIYAASVLSTTATAGGPS